MKHLLWLPLVALVAACGTRGPLVRLPDEPLTREQARELRRAQGAASEAALKPPPQAQPRRVDDVQATPAERAEDPFSLPPR